MFLVAEVASVGVLLVVSWLFVSSMVHSISIDLGIDRTNLIAVKPNKEFQGTVDEVRADGSLEDAFVALVGASTRGAEGLSWLSQ